MQWPTEKLSELCVVSSSKRIYQNEQSTEGVPFLRISDLNERIDNVKNAPELFIPINKYNELKENAHHGRWHDHENACRQNTRQERRHRGRIQMRRGNRAGIREMRKRTASGKSTSCWRLSFWRFSIGFRIITALFHIEPYF